MRWDKDVLVGLSETLETQINESIYRKALPIKSDRLDLTTISVDENFPILLVKQILEQVDGQAELQANAQYAKSLIHLFQENHNTLKNQGYHTLGLAYPCFIHSEDKYSLSPISMPIFVWQIEATSSPNRKDTWTISKKKGTKPTVNKHFLRYIKQHFDLDISKEVYAMTEDDAMNGNNLSALCNRISLKLGIEGNMTGFAVVPSPTQEELREISEEPILRFSAIIGLFGADDGTLSEYISDRIEQVDTESIFTPNPEDDFEHPFSLTVPDPCQKNIYLQTTTQAIVIAEGGNGTGKTRAAEYILANYLANKKTSVVISPSLKKLEHTKAFFEKHGLGQYVRIISDPKNQLEEFMQGMKEIPTTLKAESFSDDVGFRILLERCINKHNLLEKKQKQLNSRTFGSQDFTDTVGHYIESARTAGKDILAGRISAEPFQFSFREYDILKSDIVKGERLFSPIKKLNHPLNQIHEDVYLSMDAEKGLQFTQKNVRSFKRKTEILLRTITSETESYKDNLNELYESHAWDLQESVREIKERMSEYAHVFGEDFKSKGSVTLQMYGIFSDTYNSIKEARKDTTTMFYALEDKFNEKRYFDYKFPKRKDTERIPVIQKYVEDFEKSLNEWANGIPSLIQQETGNLSSKSVEVHLDYASRIGNLEYEHDTLLEEINQSKLFQEWLSYDSLNLVRRKTDLESLWDILESIENHLPQFQDFHPWQKHWLEILPKSKQSITALVESRTKDWLSAFESWYFHSSLSANGRINTKNADTIRKDLVGHLKILREKLPLHIRKHWHERQIKVLADFRKRNKALSSTYFSKKGKLPPEANMKDIFQATGKEIFDFYPVCLMTVPAAEELLPACNAELDMVIIDEAHSSPAYLAVPWMDLGKRTLVLGDRHQSILHQEHKSLLDTLIEAGGHALPLYFKHKQIHPDCTRFLNATSYDNGLKTIYYKDIPVREKGIFLVDANGRYNEESKDNTIEAEKLLSHLNEIFLTFTGNPSIAIVANTFSQRDEIARIILQAKQDRNELADRILTMEKTVFDVLHVSELQQDYSVILWSMTFGKIDLKGNISTHFDQAERTVAETYTNIVLGRIRKQLHIVSSLPHTVMNEQTEQNPKHTGTFSKLLFYASLLAGKDDWEVEKYLNQLQFVPAFKNEKDKDAFIEQVKYELQPYFEANRIESYSPLNEIGTASLTVKPLDFKNPTSLIIGDRLDRNSGTGAYEFEQLTLEHLEDNGYKIFKINSMDWWKHPKNAARVLASKIISIDK